MIINKTRTVLCPFLFLGTLTATYGILTNVVIFKRFQISEFDFYKSFTPWFLMTLFFMFLILWPIIRFLKSRTNLVPICAAFLLGFCLFDWNGLYLPQQVLCACFWGLLGYIIRPYLDRYNNSAFTIKGSCWLLFLVTIAAVQHTTPVLMYVNDYGNTLVFLLLSLLGIIATFDIACNLKSIKFLTWAGRNSIILYTTQFVLIDTLRALWIRLPFDLGGYTKSSTIFIFVVMAVFAIVPVINNFIPFVIGRKYPNKKI